MSVTGWMFKDVVYILLSYEKKGNPTIFNNMAGPWGHYAKWDESDKEKQILYDSSDMWNLKRNEFQKTDSEVVVTKS